MMAKPAPARMARAGFAAIAALTLVASAQENTGATTVEGALDAIAEAALSSHVDPVEAILHDDLVLVSQSAKIYGRDAALADLQSGFEQWLNEDVTIRFDGDIAIVTLTNSRTRSGMSASAFRVVQTWKHNGEIWQLLAQTSVRLP